MRCRKCGSEKMGVMPNKKNPAATDLYCLDCGAWQKFATNDEIRLYQNTSGKPEIDLQDDDFGTILNCAVRYAIGRRTYMPSLVIGFITPLIPYLNSKTLWCFDQDVTNARYEGGYGDPNIDEHKWLRFLENVRAERVKRGDKPYKSPWEG